MAWRLGSFEGHTVALYKLNLFIALYQCTAVHSNVFRITGNTAAVLLHLLRPDVVTLVRALISLLLVLPQSATFSC